ncbi:hypothetical protein LC76P1_00190 [Lysinibacillus phage LC76P1]|nr:hypothetical protein LC76P1_00190 [Lysinibacillus phage LC76P1]
MKIEFRIINGEVHYYTVVGGFHIPVTSQQLAELQQELEEVA